MNPPPAADDAPPANAEPADDASYADQVARLESIVAALEQGGRDLDETLRLFEEGMTLLKACRGQLEAAEGRLAELSLAEAEGDDAS